MEGDIAHAGKCRGIFGRYDRVQVFPQDQAHGVGVVQKGVVERVDEAAHPFYRHGVRAVEDVFRWRELFQREAQRRGVEAALVAEVVVDHPLGHASFLGQRFHFRPGVAFAGERAQGGVDNGVRGGRVGTVGHVRPLSLEIPLNRAPDAHSRAYSHEIPPRPGVGYL